MDSVPPCHGIQPRIEDGIIKSDGTTILGGDDRIGVAAILEALTVIHERGLPHLPIEIAFTAQEEPGLVGSAALDCSQFRSKRGVVFDYGDPVGKIIVSAPGTWNMDITITGRAAHAGGEPEKGINAIAVAVEAISHFKVGRLDHETTANVGMIQGGVARNVVPETCRVTAETRSRRASKLERQKKLMVAAFERAARGAWRPAGHATEARLPALSPGSRPRPSCATSARPSAGSDASPSSPWRAAAAMRTCSTRAGSPASS